MLRITDQLQRIHIVCSLSVGCSFYPLLESVLCFRSDGRLRSSAHGTSQAHSSLHLHSELSTAQQRGQPSHLLHLQRYNSAQHQAGTLNTRAHTPRTQMKFGPPFSSAVGRNQGGESPDTAHQANLLTGLKI